MPSATLLPPVIFFFQEMYGLSMSKMRSMDNQPVIKSQRFILRCKVRNLRKIREPKEAEPFFLPSSWMLLLNWALDCRLCTHMLHYTFRQQTSGSRAVWWNSWPHIQGSQRCCGSGESQLVCIPRGLGEHEPAQLSSTSKVLGCAELEQRLEHLWVT